MGRGNGRGVRPVFDYWLKEGTDIKSTGEFVDKVHDTQAKDEKNRRIHGKGQPSAKLATKQHTNNP
jgi:hypothetical protein